MGEKRDILNFKMNIIWKGKLNGDLRVDTGYSASSTKEFQ